MKDYMKCENEIDITGSLRRCIQYFGEGYDKTEVHFFGTAKLVRLFISEP